MSDGQTKTRSSSAMDVAVTDRMFHVYLVAFPRGAIHISRYFFLIVSRLGVSLMR
jgi:hypothetical protein